ncbi:DUF3006 domain-containing protein [Pelosinus sp. UFO1]|uniref:DUF3006 domain-containing protein n=1 Tax=Pelosinus sp. UFO1 TaxID=484770 RepID=UPI0004D0CA16|nr:DUF3006 domain-containing protein [Pelosinus sp. UFO1]AIF50814.1 Protein of unknown function DUF3006 [Pelosinus sp. UFO1]
MKVRAVIDRFEGSKAVLLVGEDETQVSWPCCSLPGEAAEGDILQITLQVDQQATSAARLEAENLLKEIVKRNQES